jgi:hypothetical protein
MKRYSLFIILFLLLISACGLFKRHYTVEYDKVPMTRGVNTCQELEDTVVLYAVFVDVAIYNPWTEFDIAQTMDSIKYATKWIEEKAKKMNKVLVIKPVFHEQGTKDSFDEKRARVTLRLNGLLAKSNYSYRRMGPWADAVAKYAGRGIKYRSSSKVGKRLKIHNVQTLNQALRDKLELDDVAIMFFVNGYYENHPSYSFFTQYAGTKKAEYSIVTDKNPAVIAHEFLHLFGAVDLYPHNSFPNFNFKEIKENYDNEIMLVQHRDIEDLMISPITSYFIGWQDTLDKANTRLLLHKKLLPVY